MHRYIGCTEQRTEHGAKSAVVAHPVETRTSDMLRIDTNDPNATRGRATATQNPNAQAAGSARAPTPACLAVCLSACLPCSPSLQQIDGQSDRQTEPWFAIYYKPAMYLETCSDVLSLAVSCIRPTTPGFNHQMSQYLASSEVRVCPQPEDTLQMKTTNRLLRCGGTAIGRGWAVG